MLSKEEIKELQRKKVVVESSIHPDTGKPVPWLMRMSAFVPSNVPIIFGLLMTRQTPMSTVFWQWLIQTYNAGMNYGNRNASSVNSVGDLLGGYFLAVSSSIGVTLSLKKLSKNFTRKMKGSPALLVHSIICFCAMGTAGFLNSYFMRKNEMKKGIKVYD